ncbi:MAG: hypothetical protein ACOZHQ_09240 [Thermodesulfobacteriota bacterium]
MPHFAPSRAWRAQAIALRLVATVTEQVPPAYERAGQSMPAEVNQTLERIARRGLLLWQRIGTEKEVLGRNPAAQRTYARQVSRVMKAVRAIWPGDLIQAPALCNAALLVVEEMTRQAPDDGRKALWAGIAAGLVDLLEHHEWAGEGHIAPGAAAGEGLRAALEG